MSRVNRDAIGFTALGSARLGTRPGRGVLLSHITRWRHLVEQVTPFCEAHSIGIHSGGRVTVAELLLRGLPPNAVKWVPVPSAHCRGCSQTVTRGLEL